MLLTEMMFSVLLGFSVMAMALILPIHGDQVQDMDFADLSEGINNQNALFGQMEMEKRVLHDGNAIKPESK
jgi:hypothetical protein